jgi:cation diffusion facilitator CzcD-associated flavoprotein CzcO
MVGQKKVCVIGAGVSGLAAAKVFKQHGHAVTILERSADLGGVWEPSRSYPDVQTQSPKDLYRFTDKPMPGSYPEWPKGPQVHAYLTAYAKEHGLDALLRSSVTVLSMDRPAGVTSGWMLQTQASDGAPTQEHYDFVAVCTGQFSDKNMIAHPGIEAFRAQGGLVLHSSEYTDPKIVKGRRVVVLGGSKSATDIVVSAVKAGASAVTNVYLESVWRVPYFIGGLINFKRILYIRAQEEMFPGWDPSRLSRLKHAIAKPFVWANWRALESLLKMQLKLKRCDMVPTAPIESTVSCATPIATPDYFPMVADGRIKAIKGTFQNYQGSSIVMSGGQKVPADVAILAVGWKLGVPFLAERFRRKLVEPDGLYRLYRVIVNPDLPDMGFVGFNSSFCTVLNAEMAAHWLVRYADGQLARQPSAIEMNDNIEMMLQFKRTERPAARVYGGLCVAPFHFKHFDELLDDMGATKRRRSALAEKFTPPDADAFATYLASTPRYAVTAA